MKTKNELRNWAKNLRKKLDMNTISLNLCQKLISLKEYKNAKNIMLFYPLKHEVNLLSLLEDKTKTFYLPKINGDNMHCCSYSKGETLCMSCFKTFEPISNQTSPTNLDLIIIPALACDKNNFRLGYGKGYYDKFLRQLTATKICCIPKELYVETVLPEQHDIKMDIIIY